MSDPIFDPLNDKQEQAVLHGEGPLLILAGAGSGKTRAITHRMAHLIRDREVAPYKILGVTFTNKAADEMAERTEQLVGRDRIQPELSTFHSLGAKYLREEAQALEHRDRHFTIYDDTDQRSVIKSCMEEAGIDPDSLKPRSVITRISRAKDQLMGPDEFKTQDDADPKIADLYERYQKHLVNNNAFDFGDLIAEVVYLLQENKQVREKYQTKYEHLLVDEFQDTNPAQYELARILAEQHQNFVVVGDDDQSIYSWRGADVTNILSFEEDFPKTETIRLEQNYRSTQPILEAAHNIIKRNPSRKEKELWTSREEGMEPTVYEGRSDYDEAEWVLETIETLENMRGISPGDCAIFFRTNAQTRVFEEVFMRENMPYVIVSGVGFYERKEIKDLMAYLKLIVNPSDDQSFLRIVNTPTRGIGKKTLGQLREFAAERDLDLTEALRRVVDQEALSSRATSALNGFLKVYRALREAQDQTPLQVLETVLDKTRYVEEEVEKEDDQTAETRKENIEELRRVADNFSRERAEPTLSEFVEEISLISDVDTFEEQDNRVNIMTLHSAKGLEFPVVFMAGMEEGLLPHGNSEYDQERLEEERRLCYVGFTRAQDRLYCTWARKRWMYGMEHNNDPSRFLKEAGLMEEESTTTSSSSTSTSDPFSTPDRSDEKEFATVTSDVEEESDDYDLEVEPGDQVKHGKFGTGTVVEITDPDGSPMATIDFDSVGEKQLALSFARLEKV